MKKKTIHEVALELAISWFKGCPLSPEYHCTKWHCGDSRCCRALKKHYLAKAKAKKGKSK